MEHPSRRACFENVSKLKCITWFWKSYLVGAWRDLLTPPCPVPPVFILHSDSLVKNHRGCLGKQICLLDFCIWMSRVKKMVGFVCTTHIQNAIMGTHGRSYYPQFALGAVNEGSLINHCCRKSQRAVSVGMRADCVCLWPRIHLPSGWEGAFLSGNSAKVLLRFFLLAPDFTVISLLG